MDFKRMKDQAVTFEIFAEEMVKISLVIALIFTRLATVQIFKDYFTVSSMLRLYFPAIISLSPAIFMKVVSSP